MYRLVNDYRIERNIEEKWIRGIYYSTFEDRSNEIHVTDLSNPCLRQVVLRKKNGAYSFDDIDKNFLKKTWAGKQLHETPFGELHEYAFRYRFDEGEYGYIVGSADEILDNVVVDKKFYAYIPKSPYEHHVRQVLYYIAIITDKHEKCDENGCVEAEPLNIKYGALMYINRDKLDDKVFLFEPEDLDEIRKEMIDRAKKIRDGMKYNIMPKGEVSYMCKWCEFKDDCEEVKKNE